MTPIQWTYLTFAIVIVLALIFDLGLFSKKNQKTTIKTALLQSIFWVGLSVLFFGYMWYEDGAETALSFMSAYLMEKSLSIDNIFVFILLFNFFKIKEENYSRVLLIGILMALVFRAVFISVGVVLIQRFDWILYIFGVFLIYTGIKMFVANPDDEFKPEENVVYRFMNKYMRVTTEDPKGRFVIRKHNKAYLTTLSLVVVMLAVTDIIFAVDSIPAVFAISQQPVVVYTSNIFAVLGLRSLFFLLRGAVDKFEYLPQGIAIILVFIGLKMLAAYFIHIPVYVSLIMIVLCLGGSILYSLYHQQKESPVEK
ncbi:TerC/Alx family metal homeostasis membrane protein [Chitinophaga nivalis]|uniref:TerC/Alx family metal homeostasis membrane protein n=1 Tax=Chitinophaga nivalis TaxID=2991709 RepID=A0ABT3ITY1_9BACT|nr:TerC/Alx family metal homeostasis membrane protein [Chitinophaga nivalis]MCW3462866.1 TerC/Alx family metal homeostasis membrane protein [Chitinophaga nivalis]MCW3487444.1 TerC/Alx family metal homeostasis membrane protein [Chitinophaga nivalis]